MVEIKTIILFAQMGIFTEYDESNNRNSHHYTIWQCEKCDKVKITRK